MLLPLLLLMTAYLIGSIPCGLLLGRLAGIDVRQGGSGNIGATNVNRQLGKSMGMATLLGDIGKAILPMALTSTLLARQPNQELWTLLTGAAAFVGHLFPLYLKFKGGKGVATAFGVVLYLSPAAALILVVFFTLVVAVAGYVSMGSLAAAALMPVVLFLLHAPPATLLITAIMALLIWVCHRANIGRLLRGQEKSWRNKASSDTA